MSMYRTSKQTSKPRSKLTIKATLIDVYIGSQRDVQRQSRQSAAKLCNEASKSCFLRWLDGEIVRI